MTNLYVNTILLSDIEDSIGVNMATAQVVAVNDEIVWSRAALTPDPITDFDASDNLTNFIKCNWSESANTAKYSLADYDTQTILIENINPGYEWHEAIPGIIYNLCIVAESIEDGKIVSNVDNGKRTNNGKVIINYDSYTFEGSGEGTVDIENGVGVFRANSTFSNIEVIVIGGGGSGASSRESTGLFNPAGYSGGGYAGEILTTTIDSIDVEYPLAIGQGGAGVDLPSGATYIDGHSGTASSIVDITANGGAAGLGCYTFDYDDDVCTRHQYRGEGTCSENVVGINTCDGSMVQGYLCFSYGGQRSYGNGGAGTLHSSGNKGGIGAGGGGAGWEYSDSTLGPSGAGGNAQIIISWS